MEPVGDTTGLEGRSLQFHSQYHSDELAAVGAAARGGRCGRRRGRSRGRTAFVARPRGCVELRHGAVVPGTADANADVEIDRGRRRPGLRRRSDRRGRPPSASLSVETLLSGAVSALSAVVSGVEAFVEAPSASFCADSLSAGVAVSGGSAGEAACSGSSSSTEASAASGTAAVVSSASEASSMTSETTPSTTAPTSVAGESSGGLIPGARDAVVRARRPGEHGRAARRDRDDAERSATRGTKSTGHLDI